jgi:uncharacterized protein (TIGR02145 family)
MALQIINTSNLNLTIRGYCIVIGFCFAYIYTSAQIKPFGSVKVDKDVYFDETEVDVGSWLSYYTWVLENEGYNAALKVLPDSTKVAPEVWTYIMKQSPLLLEDEGRYTREPIGFFEKPFNENEITGIRTTKCEYRELLDLPITGLTYEQAGGFCNWRTIHIGHNKLTFRLPTAAEWKNFALKGLSKSERLNGCKDSITEKKCLFNFRYSHNCQNNNQKLNCIGSFPPNKSGGFEIFGNVSEMMAEKGEARGGNYMLYAKQCHVDSIQHFSKPENWVGFRCIAVKKNEKIISYTNQNTTIRQTTDTVAYNGEYGLFTDKRDGKIYRTIKIGHQTWMAENFAYKPNKGNYWAYEKNDMYVAKYGYLYTWETARTICPVGWHLPSKEEYEILLKEIGNNTFKEMLNGGKSRFSVVFVGTCSGLFHKDLCTVYNWTAFWTTNQDNDKNAFMLQVGPSETKLITESINQGYPVRYIKNE